MCGVFEKENNVVTLPYEKDFLEKNIPTKARPIEMNRELLNTKKRNANIVRQKIIRPFDSSWSCTTFYVNNQAKKESS